MRKSFFLKKSGIILIEALGAVALLVVGSIAASSAIQNSTSSLQLSRDYLIAENLTKSGMEITKNIRATNLLLRPEDRTCWLSVDLADSVEADCSTIRVSDSTDYIPEETSNGLSIQEVGGNPLDLKADGDHHQPEYQLYLDASGYHNGTTGTATKFYRSIHFSEIGDDKAKVETKLQWFDGKKVTAISYTGTLYNH